MTSQPLRHGTSFFCHTTDKGCSSGILQNPILTVELAFRLAVLRIAFLRILAGYRARHKRRVFPGNTPIKYVQSSRLTFFADSI